MMSTCAGYPGIILPEKLLLGVCGSHTRGTALLYVTSCHDRTLDPYLIPPNSPELLQPSDLRMKRPRAATRCSST